MVSRHVLAAHVDSVSIGVEIHRTEKDYENALTLKMFLFQFVNFYASIFYIAFIKPWFANPPGVESYKIGKYKTEEVSASADGH